MSKKILLADDSVTIRKVVELTFMEEDYDLTSVSDGREALDHLRESVPDLVIADVHMGEVSGLDVCREVKTRWPEKPVLLLVGTFEALDPADVTKCGADDSLKKPFDSQDLLGKVGRLLGQRTDSSDIVAGAQPVDHEPLPPEIAQAEESEEEPEEVPASDELETAEEAAPEPVPSEVRAHGLSEDDVDRISRRVVELLSDRAVRDIAWEVVPDMAEVVIKDRLRDLESQVE
jgi:DNA-binding response OmpR family regulator